MHDLLPPAINVAALQSLTPIYLNLSLASFFPPLHIITATSFSFITASTPIIALTFFVTSAPPAVQALAGAFPLIIAIASPEHPGNPQAPQFVPGRVLLIASSLGSNFTKNFFEARDRLIPNTRPKIPRPIIADNIFTYLGFLELPSRLKDKDSINYVFLYQDLGYNSTLLFSNVVPFTLSRFTRDLL